LTAHLGNFELLPTAHAMYGYQIDPVHHTQRFAAGEALMTFVRERAGDRVIRKHAAARAVLRALRQGRVVGVTFDQNASVARLSSCHSSAKSLRLRVGWRA
jgi:lauroyl/myristoyl acyltransferase